MKKQPIILLSLCMVSLMSCQPASQQEPEPLQTNKQLLTGFMLRKIDNPSLSKDIVFDYDSALHTFYYHTQSFIDSIHTLIPTFFANGTAFVDGVEVTPCITPQDFTLRPITYQIRQGKIVQSYNIELRCPQSTGLPVLDIQTSDGKEITSKTEYSDAAISIYTQGQPQPYLAQQASIRGRGNSTWWYAKKPYRIKLDKKAELFGMQSAKTWVLLANAIDPTLLCNTVALEIANRMQCPFVNHTQPVELFINRQYRGSYTLTEAIQVKKNRIEIDTLAGGFLTEFDSNYDEVFKAHSQYFALPIMMKAPESQEGLDNAVEVINQLEKVLRRNHFSYSDYYQIVDVESLIRYMLLNELCKNGEVCHPKSVYAYRKDSNDLLHFGPPWDFDWAYGYTGANYHYFTYPESLIFHADNNSEPGSKLFGAFLRDPTFYTLAASYWHDFRPQLDDIEQYIYQQGDILRYSQQENAIRWEQEKIHYETYLILMADFLHQRIDAITNTLSAYAYE